MYERFGKCSKGKKGLAVSQSHAANTKAKRNRPYILWCRGSKINFFITMPCRETALKMADIFDLGYEIYDTFFRVLFSGLCPTLSQITAGENDTNIIFVWY